MRNQSKTCIAVIKNKQGKLIMAGDRQVSTGWSFAYKCPFPKIRKQKNGMIIGASGDSALCKLLVDILNLPNISTTDPDTYMYYIFQKKVMSLLESQPGYLTKEKQLNLPKDTLCSALVVLDKRLFSFDITGEEEGSHGGSFSLDDVPTPFAIGCGSRSCLPILTNEYKELGYNTKETLAKAMETAAELSPGCDNNIDYVISNGVI